MVDSTTTIISSGVLASLRYLANTEVEKNDRPNGYCFPHFDRGWQKRVRART
jgi:hypothetical protein